MITAEITDLHGDRGVVNAARVSFDKIAENYTEAENDKLIKYLFKHGHWSPFAHPHMALLFTLDSFELINFFSCANLAGFTWRITDGQDGGTHHVTFHGSLWAWYQNHHFFPQEIAAAIRARLHETYPVCARVFFNEAPKVLDLLSKHHVSVVDQSLFNLMHDAKLVYYSLRITSPIFIARQLVKHQVGLTWNEVSRRYVDDTPELWNPELGWRLRADKVKQGSSDETMSYDTSELDRLAVFVYNDMLEKGIAPEDARINLPVKMETSWVWTGHAEAWRRILLQRLDPHAQKYTQELAGEILEALVQAEPLFNQYYQAGKEPFYEEPHA